MNQDQTDAGFDQGRPERVARAHAAEARERRDASPAHRSAIELGAPIPFVDRLTEMIGRSPGVDNLWKRAGEQHG